MVVYENQISGISNCIMAFFKMWKTGEGTCWERQKSVSASTRYLGRCPTVLNDVRMGNRETREIIVSSGRKLQQ